VTAMMGDIEHRNRVYVSGLRIAGYVTVAGLYLLSPAFWSSVAWGQQNQPQVQTEPRAQRPRPKPIVQPKPVQPSPPNLAPVALPVTDPNSPLGSALASCDKGSEASEPLSLPGARGEVTLDRCYRGRDHLICNFNTLRTEAISLLENSRKIVEAKYPDVSNVDSVCSIKPNTLATDLQNASDFSTRFKALKAEYDARTNCANRVEQSLRDVTLPDMAQAPGIIKSMIDSIEGDMKSLSAVQVQVAELAENIDSSQKAMLTIQKIHRTMCVRDQRSATGAIDRASR
jgi:hypothetical protein